MTTEVKYYQDSYSLSIWQWVGYTSKGGCVLECLRVHAPAGLGWYMPSSETVVALPASTFNSRYKRIEKSEVVAILLK
jgi:hypothetical protein